MAARRRFTLFVCFGAVVLLALSFGSSGREAIRQLPLYTSNLSKSFNDKEALERIAPEFAHQVLSRILGVKTTIATPTSSVWTAPSSHTRLPSAQVTSDEARVAQSSFAAKSQEDTAAATHTIQTTSSVQATDPFYASDSINEYAYLSTASSSPMQAEETSRPKASDQTPASQIDATASQTSAVIDSATTSAQDSLLPASPSTQVNETEFGGHYWFFQDELTDYPLPEFDVQKLKTLKPHNYQGPGHETYATFLSTRNSSLQDPYFLATMQVAFRLLWDERSKSEKHPFTVFVADFIPQLHRDYLRAAGAIVEQLDHIEWHPANGSSEAEPRWVDMFTKLHMWAQTDFSRILYLDTDAFPMVNIDELFDMAQSQRCDAGQLEGTDQSVIDQICDYTFTAVNDNGGINAGMMIFNPNEAMHDKLIRESRETEFDNKYLEQAFLNVIYRDGGPFPAQFVDRKYNALFTTNEDKDSISVIHEKLWAMYFTPEHFALNYFRQTWQDMTKMYNTTEFADMRRDDEQRSA